MTWARVKALPLRRKLILGAALIGLAWVVALIPSHLKERKLYRELAAYQETIHENVAGRARAPKLSPEVIPVLLKWITNQTAPGDGMRRFMERVRSFNPWDKSSYSSFANAHYPRSMLAILGFEALGKDAAIAVPTLCDLAIAPGTNEEVFGAIAAIGEPSFSYAIELTTNADPNIRAKGAAIIGALQVNPDSAVALLMRLTKDPHPAVRAEAFTALASFPKEDVSAALLARLPALAPVDAHNAAYALHGAETNVLLELLAHAAKQTNVSVRSGVLASLAIRDTLSSNASRTHPWDEYMRNRSIFNIKALQLAFSMYKGPLDEQFFAQVQSNILTDGESKIIPTLQAFRFKKANQNQRPAR